MTNCKKCSWYSCICCNEFVFKGDPDFNDKCKKCKDRSEFELDEFFKFCPKTGEKCSDSVTG